MSLKGHLGTIPLPELLQWLAIGQKTGTLVILKEDGVHRIVVDGGRVISTATSDPEMQLGRRLVESGAIDEETLRRAFKLKEATEMALGQVLLTLQAMSEEELREAMKAKAEALISRLFHSTDASFQFVEGAEGGDPGLRLSLDATQLVLSAAHNLEERTPDELPLAGAAEADSVDSEPADNEPLLAVAVAPAGVRRVHATDRETVVEALPENGVQSIARGGKAFGRLAAAAVLLAALTTVLLVFRQDQPAEAEEAAGVAGPESPATTRLAPLAAAGLFSTIPQREEPAAEVSEERQLEFPPEPPADDGDGLAGVVSDAGPAPAAVAAANVVAVEALLASREAEVRDELQDELADLRRQLVAAEERAIREPTPSASESSEDPGSLSPAQPPIPPTVKSEERLVPAGPVADRQAEPAGSESIRIRQTPARPLSRPAPDYPPAALRLGREAEVTLRVLVDAEGVVREVESVGDKVGMGFEQAAAEAARRSRWVPATESGIAVTEWVELRFSFKAP